MPESARYRDSFAYAVAAIATLAASALFDAWLFVMILRHVDPKAPDAPAAIWIQLHVLLRIATAFAFLTWFDCLYANLITLRGTTNHARWWAMGGFFVPPFCLFRPCEIGIELWRAPKKDGAPILVFVWWAAVLQMVVLFVLGRGLYYFASVLAAGLAIALVRVLTSQLEEARLESQREERRLLREQKTAAAVRVPPAAAPNVEPAPAPTPTQSPGLAPHLAAIQQAAASRAAERRATVTGYVPRPVVPFMQADDDQAQEPVSPAVPGVVPQAPAPPPRPSPQDLLRTVEARIDIPVMPQPQRSSPQDLLRPASPPRIILPVIQNKKGSTSGDAIWVGIAAAACGGTAILTFLIAAKVVFRDESASRNIAGVYAGAGVVLALMASFLGRYRAEATEEGWTLSAIAAAVVAFANLLAASWFALQ